MCEEIIHAILGDDLKKAEILLGQKSDGFELVLSLLKKIKNKPSPLNKLRSHTPMLLKISLSYTCYLNCEMCSIQFPYRSSIFKDRKYLLPEELNKLSPWIERASHVVFCGEGETLYSPHLYEFLKKLKKKTTSLVTSGVPLNPEKIRLLIKAELNVLHFSFDGKTSAGHGAGKDEYIRTFWKKVETFQKIKKELNSKIPLLGLQTAINAENIDYLEELFAAARRHEVNDIVLIPMFAHSEALLEKTIYKNYEESTRKINKTILRWNKKGMYITVMNQHKKIDDFIEPCFFVDNLIEFRTELDLPFLCCNTLRMPLEFNGSSTSRYINSFPFRYLRYLHFCSEAVKLPEICQTCWVTSIKRYYETRAAELRQKTGHDAYALYLRASKLKTQNRLDRAKTIFQKVLGLKPSSSLIGKTYFHLGEISIMKEQYKEALSFMKLAVQRCFDHKKAFVYLYLLFMLLEDRKTYKRKKKAYFNYFKYRAM